ncbi:MAG: hypothetical protein V4636_05455 [Pseudomonadota bacterium]
MSDSRDIKTYVWHGEQCYFVSTITRDSSCEAGHRFSETIVWEYDWATGKRGGCAIGEFSSPADSIEEHQRQVAALHATGECA